MFDNAALQASQLVEAPPLEQRQILARPVHKVTVHSDRIEVFAELGDQRTTAEEDHSQPTLLTIATRIVHTGKRTTIFIAPSQGIESQRNDPPLIKLVAKAYAARIAAEAGNIDPKALAHSLGHDKDYFARLVRLGYLAPDIVTAILDGRQPATLTRQHLARVSKLPFDWCKQRVLLDFTSALSPTSTASQEHHICNISDCIAGPGILVSCAVPAKSPCLLCVYDLLDLTSEIQSTKARGTARFVGHAANRPRDQ